MFKQLVEERNICKNVYVFNDKYINIYLYLYLSDIFCM